MGMHSARDREIDLQTSIQHRDPPQREAKTFGIAQDEPGNDLAVFDVQVGLVEPVEEYQAVRAGFHQTPGHVSSRAEIWTQLDRHRDRHRPLHVVEHVHVHAFYLGARYRWIGRDVVNVELERIGPGLFD